MTPAPAQRAKLHAIGDGKAADPTFTTRGDLEAWVKDLTGQTIVAGRFAMAKDPDHAMAIYASAIAQLERVAIAHLDLPFPPPPHTERPDDE